MEQHEVSPRSLRNRHRGAVGPIFWREGTGGDSQHPGPSVLPIRPIPRSPVPPCRVGEARSHTYASGVVMRASANRSFRKMSSRLLKGWRALTVEARRCPKCGAACVVSGRVTWEGVRFSCPSERNLSAYRPAFPWLGSVWLVHLADWCGRDALPLSSGPLFRTMGASSGQATFRDPGGRAGSRLARHPRGSHGGGAGWSLDGLVLIGMNGPATHYYRQWTGRLSSQDAGDAIRSWHISNGPRSSLSSGGLPRSPTTTRRTDRQDTRCGIEHGRQDLIPPADTRAT